MTQNSQLTHEIEQIVKGLYECESQDSTYPVSEGARAALDIALGISPMIATTPHQLLGRLVVVLERVCFHYAVGQASHSATLDRLTEPHQIELHHWSGRSYFN